MNNHSEMRMRIAMSAPKPRPLLVIRPGPFPSAIKLLPESYEQGRSARKKANVKSTNSRVGNPTVLLRWTHCHERSQTTLKHVSFSRSWVVSGPFVTMLDIAKDARVNFGPQGRISDEFTLHQRVPGS